MPESEPYFWRANNPLDYTLVGATYLDAPGKALASAGFVALQLQTIQNMEQGIRILSISLDMRIHLPEYLEDNPNATVASLIEETNAAIAKEDLDVEAGQTLHDYVTDITDPAAKNDLDPEGLTTMIPHDIQVLSYPEFFSYPREDPIVHGALLGIEIGGALFLASLAAKIGVIGRVMHAEHRRKRDVINE